jgi:hypothetical protein
MNEDSRIFYERIFRYSKIFYDAERKAPFLTRLLYEYVLEYSTEYEYKGPTVKSTTGHTVYKKLHAKSAIPD